MQMYFTYLINLDRANDRLILMEKEFEKCKLPFNRISAIDARNLDNTSYRVDNKYDRDLVPGEIGCYLSHIKTLEEFLKSDNDFAVIIEDDAILQEDFKDVVEKAIFKYQELPKKHQWDILKLYNGKRRNIKVKSIDDKYFIGACGTSVPITTIAAIWTRLAAEKFLNKVIQTIPVIKRPIDCDLQHPWEYDLIIYNLLPSLIKTADVETQIQIDKSLRKSKFPLQIIYEVKRIIPKYYYLIEKHGLGKFLDSFIFKKNDRIA